MKLSSTGTTGRDHERWEPTGGAEYDNVRSLRESSRPP